MVFTKTMIPVRARDSFFRDEFFSDCWDVMERQKKEFEQKCADSLSSKESILLSGGSSRLLGRFDDYQSPLSHRRIGRIHPASLMMMDTDHLARKFSSGLGIHSDRDNFKVSLDVQQFGPEELTVKTVDSTIVIEGKHEEKEDRHGFVSRHFQRKYTLPSDVKSEEVQCSFTADGRLHITAPRHYPQLTSIPSSTSNNADSSHRAAYEKETFEKTATTNSMPSTSKTTPVVDKFREELRQAEEKFEKSVADSLAARSERREAFREEVRKAQEDFDKSTATLLSRDREDFKHSRLLRMFEPHFTAFPEFDPLPFWRRGKTSTLLEEFDKKSSIFDDVSSSSTRFGKSTESDISKREVQEDSENFKVILDVHEFKPEELNVKTFDYFVEIEGKHEAREDPHGHITRHFKRKYTLPRDVKAADVHCNLSSEGILVVTAPRQKLEELAKNPTVVPIQQKKEVLHDLNTNVGGNRIDSIGQVSDKSQLQDKVYQNTSTVHQVYSERKTAGNSATTVNGHGVGGSEYTIPITQINSNPTVTPTHRPQVDIGKTGERVIPIDQEASQSSIGQGGFRVDFPESRPESSASSIPFDFSRGKSEEPVSVASSIQPTFETLTTPEPGTTPIRSGERLIKIRIDN